MDVGLVFGLLLFGLYVLALIRHFGNRLAKEQTVRAEVIGKQTVEQFSKYSGSGKSKKYVIIFSVEGQKKSFYVSEFSYGGYRKGEKGMLTFKGDRLIDFQ